MQLAANRAFLPQLTGLRGAAALWVFFYHVSIFLGFFDWPAFHFGNIGVDIFFVLSGFILGHVHLDDFVEISATGIGRFLTLRLSRIYPVHFVTLAASLILAGILHALGLPLLPRFGLALAAANLLLVQAWGWIDHTGFNTVSWSISGEWMAYLAFPVIAFLANRLPGKAALVLAFFAIMGEVLIFRALGRADTGDITTFVPLRMGGEFICGVCLYVVYRSEILAVLPWGAIADLAILGFGVAIACSAPYAAVLIIPIGILGLAYGAGMGARFLSTDAMIFLGEISYSLYMVHLLILECIFAPIHYTRLDAYGLPLKIVALLIASGLIGVATLLMHRHVEVPARLWVRRRLDRVSKPHAAMPIP